MKAIFTALWLAGLFGAPAPAAAQDTRAGLSVTIKGNADRVRVGSAIVVEVTLKNISGRELHVFAGSAGTDIDVQDEGGRPVKTTREGNVFKGGSNSIPQPDGSFILEAYQGSGKILTMEPNESWKHEIVVSKLFELGQPGVYAIQAKRQDSDTHILAKSNIVKVTVVP